MSQVTLIRCHTIYTPDVRLKDGWIAVREGKIYDLGCGTPPEPFSHDHWLDAGELLVVPGLVDLHLHGGGGREVMEGSLEALRDVARVHAANGTCTIVPATVSASPGALQQVATAVAQLIGAQGNEEAEIVGLHLEGPFICPEKKGAHVPEHIRAVDRSLLDSLQELSGNYLRIVTMAPELPGALELIADLTRRGILVSMGHSRASYDVARQAIAAGATQVTHLFNAMDSLHHRQPGLCGAALATDSVVAELIADGFHIHPAVLSLVAQVKGPDRLVLVTDAMAAAGLGDGEYNLGGHRVYVQGGRAALADGTLAGSTLTLHRAVVNMVKMAGVSLQNALKMASQTPAMQLGLQGRKGCIRPGADADLVFLDQALEVKGVMVRGSFARLPV